MVLLIGNKVIFILVLKFTLLLFSKCPISTAEAMEQTLESELTILTFYVE